MGHNGSPPTATTVPPAPSPSPGNFTDPNVAGSGPTTTNLSTSLSGAFGIPTSDLSIGIIGLTDPRTGQPMSLQAAIQFFQSAPASVREPLVAQLRAAGYFAGITSGSELDQETTAYARLLRDSIWSNQDPNATLSDATQAQQANAGAAAAPRTLGLGKYPIHLTAPADVQMAADTIFQTLLGRRATPQEQQAVTAGLHALETAQGQSELQQYASQEAAYYGLQHGGIAADQSAPGAAIPVATPAAPAAPAVSNAPGGGLTGGPVTGGPIGVAPPAAATTTSTTLPANTPANQVPPGSIQLADGTWIVPPTAIASTNAPTASAQAYSYAMQNDQPEIQGRTVAAAMNAIAQFVGQK